MGLYPFQEATSKPYLEGTCASVYPHTCSCVYVNLSMWLVACPSRSGAVGTIGRQAIQCFNLRREPGHAMPRFMCRTHIRNPRPWYVKQAETVESSFGAVVSEPRSGIPVSIGELEFLNLLIRQLSKPRWDSHRQIRVPSAPGGSPRRGGVFGVCGWSGARGANGCLRA